MEATPRFIAAQDHANRWGVRDTWAHMIARWGRDGDYEDMAQSWAHRFNAEEDRVDVLAWHDDNEPYGMIDDPYVRYAEATPPSAASTPIDYATILDQDNLENRSTEETHDLLRPLAEAWSEWRAEMGRPGLDLTRSGAWDTPSQYTSHFGSFRHWLDANPEKVPGATTHREGHEPWMDHFVSKEAWQTWYVAVNHRGNASDQCQVLDKMVKAMHGMTRDQMGTVRRRVVLPPLEFEVTAEFTAGNSHFGGDSVEARIAEEVRRRVASMSQATVVEDENPDPLPPDPLFSKERSSRLTAADVAPYEADLREFLTNDSGATKSGGYSADRLLRDPSEWHALWPVFGYWLQVKHSEHPLGPFGHLFKGPEEHYAYWKKAWGLAHRAGQDSEYAQIALMLGGPQATVFQVTYTVRLPEDFEVTFVRDEGREPTIHDIRDLIYSRTTALSRGDFRITVTQPAAPVVTTN